MQLKIWRKYAVQEIVRKCIETEVGLRYCLTALEWVERPDRKAVYDYVVHEYQASGKWNVLTAADALLTAVKGIEQEPIHFA